MLFGSFFSEPHCFPAIKKGRRKTWISNRNPAIADLSLTPYGVGWFNQSTWLPYFERIYFGSVSARPSFPGQPYVLNLFSLFRITQLLYYISSRELAYPYLYAAYRTVEGYFSFSVLIYRIGFHAIIAYNLILLCHFA